MSDAPESQPAVRTWPPGRVLSDAECIELSCANCHTPWRVHRRMLGFRLRCVCDSWLEMPKPALPQTQEQLPGSTRLPAHAAADGQLVAFRGKRARRDASGLVELPKTDDGEVVYQPIPTDVAMAPGTLRRASASNQRRWTNRTLLEFLALMSALLLPQLGALLLSDGTEFVLLLPLASVVSGMLVAVVVAAAGPYGRIGFRLPQPGFLLEAVLATVVAVLFAVGYQQLLESALPDIEDPTVDMVAELGLVASLFVIAVTPAVLEEIIFRGLLQGRLLALFGRSGGLLVTAAAFAIAHLSPPVLVIHFGLGIYLGWLRERSQSLLPGMLMHFLYNGTLVVLEFQGG